MGAMKVGAPRSFGAQLKTLREAAGFTQEELATIAGSVGPCRERAGAWGTPAAPCRDHACAVRGARPDGCDP